MWVYARLPDSKGNQEIVKSMPGGVETDAWANVDPSLGELCVT